MVWRERTEATGSNTDSKRHRPDETKRRAEQHDAELQKKKAKKDRGERLKDRNKAKDRNYNFYQVQRKKKAKKDRGKRLEDRNKVKEENYNSYRFERFQRNLKRLEKQREDIEREEKELRILLQADLRGNIIEDAGQIITLIDRVENFTKKRNRNTKEIKNNKERLKEYLREIGEATDSDIEDASQ